MGKLYIYKELRELVKHCGLTLTEAWDLPVEVRHWWINEEAKEFEKGRKREGDGAQTPIPKELRPKRGE